MNKLKNGYVLSVFIVLAILTFNSGCKDFGIPDYNFVVTLGDGVRGLPEAGTYSYKELTSINYSYAFTDDSDKSPSVFINDGASPVSSIGTITMYRDIELFVGVVDIRGTWKLTLTEDNGTVYDTDIVFSGNTKEEGIFTDSRGYQGTWKNEYNQLFMKYDNWEEKILEGNVSPKYLSGSEFIVDDVIGNWKMVK